MNEGLVTLGDDLAYQFKNRLTEIESVSQELLAHVEQFPILEPVALNKRKLIAIKRIGSLARGLLNLIPEFLNELHPVILPIILDQMTFDIRTPITVIHSYVELFNMIGFDVLTEDERKALADI